MSWAEAAAYGLQETRVVNGFTVRIYEDRLAVQREHGFPISWEELQAVKQEVWGDVFAFEVYPQAEDVVNVRNTRHLWRLDRTSPLCHHSILVACTHPEFYWGKIDKRRRKRLEHQQTT